MSDSSSEPSRRVFLACGAAAACMGVAACGPGGGTGGNDGGADSSLPGGQINTGFTVADVAVGQLKFYRMGAGTGGTYIFVGRDASGFYAFDGHCTHQNFMLSGTLNSMNQITCTVHDSLYSNTGMLLSPSTTDPTQQTSLQMYRVTFNGTGPTAQIIVDTTMPLSTRTMRFPAP